MNVLELARRLCGGDERPAATSQARRRGFRTATRFIAIEYLRMSKLKHLPANPLQLAMPKVGGLTYRCL